MMQNGHVTKFIMYQKGFILIQSLNSIEYKQQQQLTSTSSQYCDASSLMISLYIFTSIGILVHWSGSIKEVHRVR